MIYLDTSVVLAHVLAEDREPPAFLWAEALVASRLLEYEASIRLHARRLGRTHGAIVADLLGRVAFLELTSEVLARAKEPFPSAVRTLDALHLASIEFLRRQGQQVSLASYDDRLNTAARALGIPVIAL